LLEKPVEVLFKVRVNTEGELVRATLAFVRGVFPVLLSVIVRRVLVPDSIVAAPAVMLVTVLGRIMRIGMFLSPLPL
jgi:hypothetical protein